MVEPSPEKRPKVVGYARVSTREQAGGYSPDSQASKIRMYTELHGLELVAIRTDLGLSGKDLNRPGLREALADLDAGRAVGLVIAKLDRLTRSVRDLDRLLNGWFTGGVKADLFSVGDSIDTTTAVGRLVLNVVVSVAQWERETIAERVQDGHDMVRREGTFAGEAPFGWRVVGEPGAKARPLRPIPEEQAILARILAERLAGRSLRAIARGLDADGVPPKVAGWTGAKVRALLRRVEIDAPTTSREREAAAFARRLIDAGASRAEAAAVLNRDAPALAPAPESVRWSASSLHSILERLARNAAIETPGEILPAEETPPPLPADRTA